LRNANAGIYREGYLKVSRRAVHGAASIDRWKIAELPNPRGIPAPPTRRRFFALLLAMRGKARRLVRPIVCLCTEAGDAAKWLTRDARIETPKSEI